jgi:hypothetical protein
MNVDELLANPATALNMDTDAVPMHAIIIVDYVDPATGARTLTALADDGLPSWALRGMLIEGYDVVFATSPYRIDTTDEDDE